MKNFTAPSEVRSFAVKVIEEYRASLADDTFRRSEISGHSSHQPAARDHFALQQRRAGGNRRRPG